MNNKNTVKIVVFGLIVLLGALIALGIAPAPLNSAHSFIEVIMVL